MSGDPSLLAEIEGAMASRSASGRGDTLRKVTDLFVGGASRFNDQQVALFDDVIGRLADTTDTPAKAELSERLSTVDNAPVNIVNRLAADDSIDVARPVLTNSKRIDDTRLADIAATKGRRHMLAIAGRRQLGERVTDTLIKRGDPQVVRTVATNVGAKVSEKGFEKLVDLAADDPHLAESVVQRQDIPHRHFRTLIALAPEPVQQRLASTNPRLAERIRQAIAEADQEKVQAVQRDYTQAKERLAPLAKAQTLNDDLVFEFAKNEQFEESVVALALLAGLTIDPAARLLTSEPTNTLLIVSRAVKSDLADRQGACPPAQQRPYRRAAGPRGHPDEFRPPQPGDRQAGSQVLQDAGRRPALTGNFNSVSPDRAFGASAMTGGHLQSRSAFTGLDHSAAQAANSGGRTCRHTARTMTTMEQRKLGQLSVSALGYGCMGLSGIYGEISEADAIAVVRASADLGITFFDTADAYGPFNNEVMLGKAVKGIRDKLIIATKFGIAVPARRHAAQSTAGPTTCAAPATPRCSGSASTCIDLYYQHRVDPSVPIEDTVGAMAELVQAGKVRYLGLSEASAKTIRRAPCRAPDRRGADRILAVVARCRARGAADRAASSASASSPTARSGAAF